MGERSLLFSAQGEGARIDIPINVAESGRYEIVVEVAQAPNYGDYEAFVDGKPTNVDTRQPATSEIPFPGMPVFHNYLPEVYVAVVRPLGWFGLAKGRHTISLLCVGKDERSAGFDVGVNDVVLEKLPAWAGTPEPETEPQLTPILLEAVPPGKEGTPVYRGLPLSAYLEKLKAASDADRPGVLRAIGGFGEDAAPALSEVASALENPSAQVRAAAAWALSRLAQREMPQFPRSPRLFLTPAPAHAFSRLLH